MVIWRLDGQGGKAMSWRPQGVTDYGNVVVLANFSLCSWQLECEVPGWGSLDDQWRPTLQPNMTAYRENIRELSVGDLVRFTANDHANHLSNGERAVVVAIDTSRPLHLDHGYCSTVHASQGKIVDRILIDADTRSAAANERAYYVAIGRARFAVTIYTDDREQLPAAMGREDVKTAALDLQLEELDSGLEP